MGSKIYEIKMKLFKKELSDYICQKTQEMHLHNYSDIKEAVNEVINKLERIWKSD